jgi:hypothetical protein
LNQEKDEEQYPKTARKIIYADLVYVNIGFANRVLREGRPGGGRLSL